MTFSSMSAWAATVVAAAAAGWLARGAAPAAAAGAAPAAVWHGPAKDAAAAPAPPLIAVSSDGQVTLRVEQQPLQWVLEQIAAQSGWAEVRALAGPSRAVASSTPISAGALPPPCAAPNGLPMGATPSRIEAFEAQLESLEEQPAALQLALESALNLPDAAIQRVAAQRLAGLHTREGIEVPASQGAP